MDLDQIVDRFAEALLYIDFDDSRFRENRKRDKVYLPGLAAMPENEVVQCFTEWWSSTYPEELPSHECVRLEVPYPLSKRAKCDLVLIADPSVDSRPEWAIEMKRIQFVGDNGKRNDFGVPKILSPYLKDRSLIHDIHRMIDDPIADKSAVLGYAFSYDFETCKQALGHHPEQGSRISELRSVCRQNDADAGVLDARALVRVADLQFQAAGVVTDHLVREFEGAWRHPCGGNGLVFAWRVANAER